MVVSSSASSVPRKRALRSQLEYGNTHVSKYKELTERIREFPNAFKSSTGLNGRSLTNWKSREHQAALEEMAGAFLEDRDNGRFFWPPDGPSRQPDSLRYPDDKDKHFASIVLEGKHESYPTQHQELIDQDRREPIQDIGWTRKQLAASHIHRRFRRQKAFVTPAFAQCAHIRIPGQQLFPAFIATRELQKGSPWTRWKELSRSPRTEGETSKIVIKITEVQAWAIASTDSHAAIYWTPGG
ncbi:hypothetical protein CSUB01_11929 [Colletotrichum sublineola]|uniref:Uncharacterized protein n=1 Tax=Colletotrichum sublineola TaxID=1173701 RepID=A0A066XLI1_COLSU|nr:hypothetical protein CSUB01_11929 [Colletotrichum sublineola]